MLEQRQRRRQEAEEQRQRSRHQPTATPPEHLREKAQGMRHPLPAPQYKSTSQPHVIYQYQHTYLIYQYEHTDIDAIHVSSYWYMSAPW